MPPGRSGNSVDEAIDRVLSAEREARAAVEECRKQAHRRLSQARAQARRILERGDVRINGLHTRSERTVARTIAALKTETKGLSQEPALDDIQLARLADVVRALAAEITGASE